MFRIRVRVRFTFIVGLKISGAGGPGVGRREPGKSLSMVLRRH